MNEYPDTSPFDFGAAEPADLGAVSARPGKKGTKQETAERRQKVIFMARAGKTQVEIAREMKVDPSTISNDLAYLARQAMESYENAEGSVLMADMMQDYLLIRSVLYEIATNPSAKDADRVSATKGLMQCVSDFRTFLVTAGVLTTESTGGGKADALISELADRLGKTDDNTNLYELFKNARAS